MQISLRWLNELVDLETIELDNLIDKLTLGGFEVEDVLDIKLPNTKTVALEISSTANRSDSLSIQGLSLEIAALLNQIPKKINYSEKICLWLQDIETIAPTTKISDNCLGFIGVTIENVNNFSSPKWLQQKLLASGLPVQNSLLDFQNYILFETGYPLEFYDLDEIYSKTDNSNLQLSLTTLKNSLNFSASNGKDFLINEPVIILQANDLPISISGIISSMDSMYRNTTKTLFIEASIFNAAKIRQQSRIVGLRTDRSSRYEKSLKNIALLESVYRFISLLRIANPKLRCKLHTVMQPVKEIVKKIQLDYQKVKQVLGPIQQSISNQETYISPKIITAALERLQFKVTYDDQNHKWDILVPTLRSDDIVREIDIIEEIGRIYGFNNFLTRLPKIKNIGNEDFDYQIRKKLTSCLMSLGLNELIQYSLVNEKTYLKNEIELVNPLVKDYSNLRSSLLPNLLKATEENLKRGNLNLEGFEYGHIFSKNSSSSIIEQEVLAGILGGYKRKIDWAGSSSSLNWFEAKGKLEQLFQKLNIITYWKPYKPIKEQNILHLHCSATILLSDGTQIGIFGQVSSILANKLNIPIDIYLFELNFNVLKRQIQQNKLIVYNEYSLYPKIVKDLSFIVKDDIPFTKIQELLYLNGTSLLKNIHLLDNYYGKSIPKNHISLCLQLVFQSDFETLQNDTIETIVANLTRVLETKFNIKIRV
jgi:phenylalanyl-tRNA synthetase beta chain